MAFTDSTRSLFQKDIAALKDGGIFKEERIICAPQSSEIDVEFPVGSERRHVINMCANNYLGLSSHAEVVAAAHKGLDSRGYGMSSVRFICGTQDIHKELEAKLTKFLGTEDTILFPSCMDANAGVFEAVLTEQDVMIADRLVHASIVDGMRLCKAMTDTFKHSDMGHLEEKLQLHEKARIRLIITDGSFSMDGDLAKLDKIVELAEKYGAMVFVDDSHASGFIGKTGRGTHEHCGVVGKIDIITTTLGKALGGASGGCVSGRREIVSFLEHDSAGGGLRRQYRARYNQPEYRAARQTGEKHDFLAQRVD
jgi:glycine C-acetyltransferase